MIEIVNLTGDYYTYLNLMITECRTLFLQTGRETLFLTHADGIIISGPERLLRDR